VLSESNTAAEMERKRGEYFASGVRLVWEFDVESRIVTVYTPDGSVNLLDSTRSLEGGDVLPGFVLALADLFSKLDQRG
jgi:Uma2 family endonuclease